MALRQLKNDPNVSLSTQFNTRLTKYDPLFPRDSFYDVCLVATHLCRSRWHACRKIAYEKYAADVDLEVPFDKFLQKAAFSLGFHFLQQLKPGQARNTAPNLSYHTQVWYTQLTEPPFRLSSLCNERLKQGGTLKVEMEELTPRVCTTRRDR